MYTFPIDGHIINVYTNGPHFICEPSNTRSALKNLLNQKGIQIYYSICWVSNSDSLAFFSITFLICQVQKIKSTTAWPEK